MNCQDALDLLYDIIDKEASAIDAREVQEHLANCRHCFETFRLEESVQDLINERLKREPAPPRLESLKSKVLRELDSVDRVSAAEVNSRPPFFGSTMTLVAAAAVVLVVAAAIILPGFDQHSSLYLPLEEAHHSALSQPSGVDNPNHTIESVTYAAESLRYRINDVVGEYRLVNGHLEDLMGTRMAHFVFRQGENLVSVFVAKAESFEIPSELKDSPITVGEMIFFVHHCRDCKVVIHQTGNVVVVTVTEQDEFDWSRFVPGAGTI